MNDPFDVGDDHLMTRATDTAVSPPSSDTSPVSGPVCPFCGLARDGQEDDPTTPCPRCTLADTPAVRKATKARIGPWYVRQARNPWAPGMKFETLVALVNRGQVTRESVVRGPTTHQLWKRAAEVKGLSREFGLCYSCGATIERTANVCIQCNRLQEPPANPDVLVEAHESASSNPPPTPQPAPPAAITQSLPTRFERSALESRVAESLQATAPVPEVSEEEAQVARQITARSPRPRPLRPASAGVDDALLTPQDLATAFQLDFSPNGKRRFGSTGAGRLGKKLFVLLLIAGGCCVAAWARPDLWHKTQELSAQGYASAKAWWNPPAKPARKITPMIPEAMKPPPAPILVTTSPVEHAINLPPPPIVEIPDLPPAPKITLPPERTPDEIAKLQAATQALTLQPPPAPAAAEMVIEKPAVIVDPENEARKLWRKAIDAEQAQDYVEAVRCYEKIKKLPADVQPPGTDIRLQFARKLAQ